MTHPAPRRLLLALAASLGAAPMAFAAPAATPVFGTTAPADTYLAAVGGGHLVAVHHTDAQHRSSLLDLQMGGASRFVRSVAELGRVTVGTDAGGRPVAVAVTCRGRCHLTAIDLATGHAHAIPRTTNAHIGTMSRGRVVFAREAAGGGADQIVDLAPGAAASVTNTVTLARADSNLLHGARPDVTSLSRSGNAIAATLEYDTLANGGSAVVTRTGSGRWKLIARSGYGEASGIARVFTGAQVDARGVRALYDGGDLDEPEVSRWTLSGRLKKRVPVAALGVTNQVTSAWFDGDYLATSPDVGAACADEPDPAQSCSVRRYGPLGLG